MTRQVTKFLKISLPLALGIFLIWYSYSKFTQEQLLEIRLYFEKADYWIIALSVFLSFLSHVSRAYRWSFMLEPMGYKPRLLNNFMAVYIAYLMNIFIPKSGEFSRAIVLDKYNDVPFEKGFGTIISERIVDLIFLLIFTLVALFIEFDVLYAYLSEIVAPTKLYFALGGLFLIVVVFFLFLKFSKSKVRHKLKQFFSGLKEGVLSILLMKKKWAFIFHTFLIWGLYLLSFSVALHVLEETSTISFGTIILTFVVGSFAVAFTNSGFGSYPFFVAGVLAVFGIPETVGTAFGWIIWISNFASIVFFGGLSFLFLPIYNRVKI